MVPLKYISNFWRTLEGLLIICEINLFLGQSSNFLTVAGIANNQEATFSIRNIELYAPVMTLSTQDNAKLLQPLDIKF